MVHKVGVIGLGTVGSRFVEQFASHQAFEVVGAWDISPEACALHDSKVKICNRPEEVVASADLVYIAVPPLHHEQYVWECVSQKTAIFCEKPLGIDLEKSKELVDAVSGSEIPAGVNFVFSSAPSAIEMQSRLADHELGKIIRVDLRLHFAKWPRLWHENAQWLKLRDQGGWTREVASHFFFLICRVFGRLNLEAGFVRYEDGPLGTLCEDAAMATFSTSSFPVMFTGSSNGSGPDIVELTIRGSDGALRIWDWYRLQEATFSEWKDLFPQSREQLGTEAYSQQLDQLDLMMRGLPHEIATFSEALQVQEYVETLLSL